MTDAAREKMRRAETAAFELGRAVALFANALDAIGPDTSPLPSGCGCNRDLVDDGEGWVDHTPLLYRFEGESDATD